MLFIEAIYRDRWDIFEDQASKAKMQYFVIGVLYLIPPIILTLLLWFSLISNFVYFLLLLPSRRTFAPPFPVASPTTPVSESPKPA